MQKITQIKFVCGTGIVLPSSGCAVSRVVVFYITKLYELRKSQELINSFNRDKNHMPYYKKNYKKNYGYLNKKKWAPFMYDITPTNFNLAPEVIDGSFVSLVTNSVETSVPTPTILKVKHIKVSLDVRFDSTALSSGFICIMFVPQGITPGVALSTQHPEWVMAWKIFVMILQLITMKLCLLLV